MPRPNSDNGLRAVPDAGPTLLLAAPYFPPEGGGLEMYAYNIGCQLVAAHGWRVIVVTTGEQKRGTVVERMGPLLVHRLSHQVLLSNSRVGFGWPSEMRRLIKRYRPDVINAHAPVPGLTDVLTAVSGSIPVVITYHVDSMLKGKRIPDAVIAPYERFVAPRVFERAHSLIAASQFVSNGILAPYADKTSVITPGVCLSTFKPGGLRNPDRILFAAGLSKGHAHKGLDVLIEALPKIVDGNPRAHLHIAGTGSGEADYREMAERFGVGDRVQFLGRLDGDALVNAYRSAAVLTLPTRSDNYPMVLLEALACATPVVATCVGGIPSIIREGRNGYMVDPGDVDALADRIGRLVGSPTAARAMGEIGRQYALEYGWPSRAAATDAVLRGAARTPSTGCRVTIARPRAAAVIILVVRDARHARDGVPMPGARGGFVKRIVRAPILRALEVRRVNDLLYRAIGRRIGGGAFVATGYEHVVYRTPTGVAKLVVATFGLGYDDACDALRMLVDRERRCQRHLGDWWVATRYEVVRIGSVYRRYAVVGHQRHVEGADLGEMANGSIDAALYREIAGFVQAVRVMPTLVGLMPDLVGTGNVVIERASARPRLRVIDTLALSSDELRIVHPDDERSMGERNDAVLDMLERRLRRVG